MRNIRISRLVDIIAGSVLAASTKAKVKTSIEELASKVSNDSSIRDQIDRNLPTIQIVDCELVAKEYLSALLSYDKFSSLVVDGNNVYDSDPEYPQALAKFRSELAVKLDSLVPLLAHRLKDSLYAKFQPISYSEVSNKLSKFYTRAVARLSRATLEKSEYSQYRVPAIDMGASMRAYLKSINTRILSDANSVFVLPSKYSVAFIAATFGAPKTSINAEMQKVVDGYTETLKTKTTSVESFTEKELGARTKGLYIGNLVHAGHISAYASDTRQVDTSNFLGVNIPSSQVAQLQSSDYSGALLAIEQNLASLEASIDYGVRVRKKFSSSASMLLDMQLSFTVSMPAKLNSDGHNKAEQAAIARAVESLTLRSISDTLASKNGKALLLKLAEEGIEIQTSPSFIDYLKDAIQVAITQGKSKVGFSNDKLATAISKINASAKVKIKPLSKVPKATKASNKKHTVKVTPLRTLQGRFTSLPTLKDLINRRLHDQIKQNMGTGSSRNVLNYRTGRLARSAHVERLTQSKEGMISIFYSYMQNPYATFSEGGQQESPRTRDPKLLISRSIKEIAAESVANRMRAILV